MPRYRRDDRAMPLYISMRRYCNVRFLFSVTARISCWSLSADCSVLSVYYIAHVRVNASRDLKLFGGKIIFEVFQPM